MPPNSRRTPARRTGFDATRARSTQTGSRARAPESDTTDHTAANAGFPSLDSLQRTAGNRAATGLVGRPGVSGEVQIQRFNPRARLGMVGRGIKGIFSKRPGAETGPLVTQLRHAAAGNFIGDTDEKKCLSLLNQLDEPSRKTVIADTVLMQQLADAFNATEIVHAVRALDLELRWKAHWIKRADEHNAVPATTWQSFLTEAPKAQLEDLFAQRELFTSLVGCFKVNPVAALVQYRGTADYGRMIATYPHVAKWFASTNPAALLLDEIAQPGIADADVTGIVSQLRAVGAWDTMLRDLPRGTQLSQANRTSMQRIMKLVPACGPTFAKMGAMSFRPAAAGGSALADLRTALAGKPSKKNDAGHLVGLVNQLAPADRAVVGADAALMRDLVGRLSTAQLVAVVDALDLELRWKAHWLKESGKHESVAATTWQSFLARAPKVQIEDFLAQGALFDSLMPLFKVNPVTVLAKEHATASFGRMLAQSEQLVKWLAATNPPMMLLDEVAHANVDPADLVGIKAKLVSTAKWQPMLDALPIGTGLPPSNRASLIRLVAQLPIDDATKLFKIRFDKPLTDGNASWDVLDVRKVWAQLDVLPDQDVTQNTVLKTFQAIAGDQGFWNDSGEIQLGAGLRTSSMGPARLPHTVRHEVGHAVHMQLAGVVNSWLKDGVKFWYWDGGTGGVEKVINSLGGFPATFKHVDDVDYTFDDDKKNFVKQWLAAHSGASAWTGQNALPTAPTRTPGRDMSAAPAVYDEWAQVLWDAMSANVRSCWSLSGPLGQPSWYKNYATLPTGTNGRVFWNHWYSKPFYFSDVAKQAIDATGDDYTAMSEKEFFANCYAEYFKDPAGYKDRSLWGGSLPGDVKDFFKEHIVDRQPYAPPVGGGAGANVPQPPSPAQTGGVPEP